MTGQPSPDKQPHNVDSVIEARWVLPVQPRGTVLEDHAVVIERGAIIDILPITAARQQYNCKQRYTLKNHLLMPGLINAHGHAAMSLLRGYADDKPLDSWLNDYIWPAEARWVGEEFVFDGSLLAITEMLRAGTTCFADMYFFPGMTATAAIQAGIRAQLAFPVFDFPTAWGQGPEDYIHKGLQLRDDYKNHALIDIAFGPHAPYTVSDDPMRQVATYAAELDASIQIHLHETNHEVAQSIALHGTRPIRRLHDLGLLTPRTQCVHMTALNDDDIELIRNAGSHVVHCPRSNLKLASGFCPVVTLLDNGINVAIGTDSAASNNSLNLFSEINYAALLAKALSGDAANLTDWQALEMATISGAKALGKDSIIGSLELGKRADIIAIDMSALEQQPVYHPVSQLVYTDSGSHVTHSWVDGQLILKDRLPTQIDMQNVLASAAVWQSRIAAD